MLALLDSTPGMARYPDWHLLDPLSCRQPRKITSSERVEPEALVAPPAPAGIHTGIYGCSRRGCSRAGQSVQVGTSMLPIRLSKSLGPRVRRADLRGHLVSGAAQALPLPHLPTGLHDGACGLLCPPSDGGSRNGGGLGRTPQAPGVADRGAATAGGPLAQEVSGEVPDEPSPG